MKNWTGYLLKDLTFVFLFFFVSGIATAIRAQSLTQSLTLNGLEGLPSYSVGPDSIGGTVAGFGLYIVLGGTLGGTLANLTMNGQGVLNGTGANSSLSFSGTSGTATMSFGLQSIAQYEIYTPLSSTPITGNLPFLPNTNLLWSDNESFTPYLINSAVTLSGSFADQPIISYGIDIAIASVSVGASLTAGLTNTVQGDNISTSVGSYFGNPIPVTVNSSSLTVSDISETLTSSATLSLTPNISFDLTVAFIDYTLNVPVVTFPVNLGSADFTTTPAQSITFNIPTASPPSVVSPGSSNSPGPVLPTLAPPFTWNAATGATGYGLYIRDLTASGQPLVYPNANGITSTPLTGTSFNLPSGYLVYGRAYRWDMTSFVGSTEGTTVSNKLYFQTPQQYQVATSSNPPSGGTTSGGGTYSSGAQVTVTATPNTGYNFVSWTENGNQVSASENYTFTVTSSVNLVANFSAIPYTVNTSSNPINGGTASGGGTYAYGSSVTVTAAPSNGFTFVNWTENGNQVSTNESYQFTVTGNAYLVANFSQIQQSYTISLSPNPSNGGSVSGGGTYSSGTQVTVIATPNNGWSFSDWTENGNQVSINSNYSFTVNNSRSLVANFSQASQSPIVQTDSATLIAGSSVTLDGTVNPNGLLTTAWFEYSRGSGLVNPSSTTPQSVGPGTNTVQFSQEVSGLSPGIQYYYEIFASNSAGTNHGTTLSFYTTALGPPIVQTLPATAITSYSVQLNATVCANGGNTTYYFEWGTTASYGQKSGIYQTGGIDTLSTQYTYIGLEAGTTYHYRVVAWNSIDTSYSQDITFTTLPAEPVLVYPDSGAIGISTNPTLVWHSSVGANSYTLEIDSSQSFATPRISRGGINDTSYSVPALAGDTTYYWRVSATDSGGTGQWSDVWSFTTIQPYVREMINLPAGWSMVSSNLIPTATALDTLLAGIKDNLVIVKDGSGDVYWPTYGINSIGNWDYQRGYQVYMSRNDTLSISGTKVQPASTPIMLSQGWNLVAYLRNGAVTSSDALAGIGDTLVIAKDGEGEVYWPAFDINTIDSMTPGQGYQLYVKDSCTLVYPPNTVVSSANVSTTTAAFKSEGTRSPSHYKPAYVNTGLNATLLVETSGLNEGDEIGVWDSENDLVGSGIIVNGRAVVTVWGNNPQAKGTKEGAGNGEKLVLTSWSSANNQENHLTVVSVTSGLTGEVLNNTLRYVTDGVMIVRVQKVEVPKQFVLEQNYPNPFNPSTTIKYGLPRAGKVVLEIYDVIGQRVKVLVDGEKSAGYHEVRFNAENLASGVYFYRLSAGSFTRVNKMILIK